MTWMAVSMDAATATIAVLAPRRARRRQNRALVMEPAAPPFWLAWRTEATQLDRQVKCERARMCLRGQQFAQRWLVLCAGQVLGHCRFWNKRASLCAARLSRKTSPVRARSERRARHAIAEPIQVFGLCHPVVKRSGPLTLERLGCI